MATPMPSTASDSTANVCSFSTSNTNTVVNAMKPGISLRLCRMPISTPVKAARSTAKLFSNAFHALKAIGIAILISISRKIGLRQPVLFM